MSKSKPSAKKPDASKRAKSYEAVTGKPVTVVVDGQTLVAKGKLAEKVAAKREERIQAIVEDHKIVARVAQECGEKSLEKMKATKPVKIRKAWDCAKCDLLIAQGCNPAREHHEEYHEPPKQANGKKIDRTKLPCSCESMTKSFQSGVYGYSLDNATSLANFVCLRHKDDAIAERATAHEPGEMNCEPLPIRENTGYPRIIAAAGKCPVKLADGKWATIREWAEETRADYEEREKKFLTVQALAGWMGSALEGASYDRLVRLQRRLVVICAEEFSRERRRAELVGSAATMAENAPPTAETSEATGAVGVPAASPTASKKPGVCKAIVAMLEEATKEHPVTREQIAERLATMFPERNAKGMRSTAFNAASWIQTEQGREVKGHKETGWWLPKK